MSGRILQGRDQRGRLELSADVCIVGSGASGAVAAQILSAAGRSVVVLEEGPHVPFERYRHFRPTQTLRHLYKDGGTTAAIGLGDTPLLSILAGRGVGGSSLLTGGVVYRIPEEVLARWAREEALTGFSPEELEESYLEVERRIGVQEVPASERSEAIHTFGRGAEERGLSLLPMRRNTIGCRGAGRCNFGCPHGAKRSVDHSYLPDALAQGTTILSDAKVTRLTIRGDAAEGVQGALTDEEGRRCGTFVVHARRTLLCASALSTPLLLLGEGVGRFSGRVGRGLTLHPGARVAAVFDEPQYGWKGAMQSAFLQSEDARLTYNAVWAPVSVLAAMYAGIGAQFVDAVARMDRLAAFGVMVHDHGGGRVHRLPGGGGLVTYRMAPEDKAALLHGIRTLASLWFDAGAKEVLVPVFGRAPLRSRDELASLQDVPGPRIECVTFHPLGTARMGVDAASAVVKPTGESWDVKRLYVLDGSIFPTSIGVNSQLPIMTLATKLARGIADEPR